MDHRVRDRLINLTPPASKAASPTTGSQHGRDAALIQLEDEPATASDPGLQGVSCDPSLNAAPEEGNVSDQDNAAKSEAGEVHGNQKKQAKHLEKVQEVQDALWQGLHQLQYIVFEANELEEAIEGLPKDGLNDSLLLAIRSVSKSLTGVRHVVKSNIVLMEEASGTSYSSKAVDETRKTTVELATPEMSGSGSQLQATRDYDDQEDLLLDEVSPSTEDVANTPLDAPGDQPPAAWNIASPGAADPFVDAPQARGPLSLTFHPDITSIAAYVHPKLWVVGLPSRRVILKNLPPDMTLAHISRGIRSQGGLISMQMLNTAPIFNNHTTTAMLEFFNPQSAADFTKAAGSSPLMYETKHGHQYRAQAWLIPTASYYISQTNKACIFSKSTRAMMFKGFPKECIWFFLYIIGLTKVVRADYDPINDSLTVEFTTIFEAGRVDRLIWTGRFSDFYRYDEGNGQFKISLDDPTDVYESKYGPQTLENPVKHHLDDDLDAKWNCYPYNDYLPPSLRDTAPACPTRLPLRTRIALQREIDETEVDGYLDDLENHEDTDYHIVGTSATIKRRKHGFSISNEDENKLLLANTLHDPDWADYWDEHYKCRGEMNRRRYEHYGAVARHRREVAAEQGLGEEAVPGCCSRGCEMGCRDMKETPAAPVIREFLSAVNSSTIKKGRGK